MAKYIKAEALIDDLRDLAEANKGTYHEEGFKNAITVVEMQPTADVVSLDECIAISEQLYAIQDELSLIKFCFLNGRK